VAGAVALAAGGRQPAHAGTVAQSRQQAAGAAARVTALSARLVAMDGREGAAEAHLTAVRAAAAAAVGELRSARSALQLQRHLLAALVVAAYKHGSPNTTAFLLSSHSLSDLISRIEVSDRVTAVTTDAVAQLRLTTRQVARAGARLKRAQASAAALVVAIARRRGTIARSLALQRRLFDRLQVQIDRLVARSRAEAAARRRARAAAPNPPAAAPAPVSGGAPPQPGPPVSRAAIVAMIDRVFRVHAAVALAVAERESGLDPNAHNRSGASGLFQLMPIWWRGKFDPFDPAANIAAAYAISRHGTDWSAWGGP